MFNCDFKTAQGKPIELVSSFYFIRSCLLMHTFPTCEILDLLLNPAFPQSLQTSVICNYLPLLGYVDVLYNNTRTKCLQ